LLLAAHYRASDKKKQRPAYTFLADHISAPITRYGDRDRMTLGLRIRTIRKKMQMTQQQLAKKAGVSQATVSDYENDVTKNHRADELMRFAAALETTPEYLLEGTGPESIRNAASDLDTLVESFNKLSPASRAALIAAAKAMALTPK
jgi:transcriptional regulator with XRE-family HTH domain